MDEKGGLSPGDKVGEEEEEKTRRRGETRKKRGGWECGDRVEAAQGALQRRRIS